MRIRRSTGTQAGIQAGAVRGPFAALLRAIAILLALDLARIPVSVAGSAESGSVPGERVLWREDFSSDPSSRGWRIEGDASHFAWDATRARLAVTWDSRRPNAFFHLPLPTVLTRADSFRFRCGLVLDDIATESPDTTFQIAFGLIRQADAFSPSSFRGAGIHPTWGSRMRQPLRLRHPPE